MRSLAIQALLIAAAIAVAPAVAPARQGSAPASRAGAAMHALREARSACDWAAMIPRARTARELAPRGGGEWLEAVFHELNALHQLWRPAEIEPLATSALAAVEERRRPSPDARRGAVLPLDPSPRAARSGSRTTSRASSRAAASTSVLLQSIEGFGAYRGKYQGDAAFRERAKELERHLPAARRRVAERMGIDEAAIPRSPFGFVDGLSGTGGIGGLKVLALTARGPCRRTSRSWLGAAPDQPACLASAIPSNRSSKIRSLRSAAEPPPVHRARPSRNASTCGSQRSTCSSQSTVASNSITSGDWNPSIGSLA